MFNNLLTFDINWMLAWNHFANSSKFWSTLIFILGQYIVFAVLATLIVCLFINKKTRRTAIRALLICLGSLVISKLIGFFVARPAPATVAGLQVLFSKSSFYGFPSGHAIILFSVATSIWLSGYKKLGGTFFGLAILVGICRIAAGFHYPSDIIIGGILGIFIAWLVCKYKNFNRKIYFFFILACCLFVLVSIIYVVKNNKEQNIPTTVQRVISPNATPSTLIELIDYSAYDQYGYGKFTYSAGLPYDQRLDLLPATFNVSALKKKTKLLSFFTISDIHITDKEAPNQFIYYQQLHPDSPLSVALASGSMIYNTQFFDATVQTINALDKQNSYNFGLSLGDTTNSASNIEARWYLDILDGKIINPSSGAHLGTAAVDYQKSFQAAGLNKNIPWYQVLGNHDHFWTGSLPVTPLLQASYTSNEVMKFKDFVNPADPNYYYMGVFDGLDPSGRVINSGPISVFTNPPTVAADPDRRALDKTSWTQEFFNTTSFPVGHGLNLVDPNQESGFSCYSFEPKAELPLKVIVLDDTDPDDGDYSYIHGHGYLNEARWDWLKKELAEGDNANQLMIIAAHVPIGVEPVGSAMSWSTKSTVTQDELIAELQRHPNLLAWLSGHRHLNTVKAFISPDQNHPENGFWEIETPSLKDFPQQFRDFEIDLNSDYTISIFTTDVDPDIKEGSLAAKARKFSIGALQIYKSEVWDRITERTNPTNDPTIKEMPTGSYNAELVKKLSPLMETVLGSKFK